MVSQKSLPERAPEANNTNKGNFIFRQVPSPSPLFLESDEKLNTFSIYLFVMCQSPFNGLLDDIEHVRYYLKKSNLIGRYLSMPW